MRQVLENNAGHRALFINTTLDSLRDAEKASGKAVCGQTREVIIDAVRGKLGERLANSIANALKLKHIKEHGESHPKEEEATPHHKPPTRRIINMRAIHRLTDNATSKLHFIKTAMGNLPQDEKYDVHALLGKARKRIKNRAKNTVGRRTAKLLPTP